MPLDHPGETLFGEAVLNYAGMRLNSGSPVYQFFYCQLFVFGDEMAVQRAFAQACDQGESPAYPEVGEEACSLGEGIVQLYFRRSQAMAAFQADV